MHVSGLPVYYEILIVMHLCYLFSCRSQLVWMMLWIFADFVFLLLSSRKRLTLDYVHVMCNWVIDLAMRDVGAIIK